MTTEKTDFLQVKSPVVGINSYKKPIIPRLNLYNGLGENFLVFPRIAV